MSEHDARFDRAREAALAQAGEQAQRQHVMSDRQIELVRREDERQEHQRDASVAALDQHRTKEPPTDARAVKSIPYDELDPNIVALVRAVNAFEGIRTRESCGGHEPPLAYPTQTPAGQWGVIFEPEHSEAGWRALEFLAWFFNGAGLANVRLTLNSFPPYLNEPGKALYFSANGKDVDPDDIARELDEARQHLYGPPRIDRSSTAPRAVTVQRGETPPEPPRTIQGRLTNPAHET